MTLPSISWAGDILLKCVLCLRTNIHTWLRYNEAGQTPLTVSILLPRVIYRLYESLTERGSWRERERERGRERGREGRTDRQIVTHTRTHTYYLLVSSSPPLFSSLVIKTCQEIIGSTEKGQILFSQFKFF